MHDNPVKMKRNLNKSTADLPRTKHILHPSFSMHEIRSSRKKSDFERRNTINTLMGNKKSYVESMETILAKNPKEVHRSIDMSAPT
jgi:hypothetical protein